MGEPTKISEVIKTVMTELEDEREEKDHRYPCECGCGCKKRVAGNATYCSACAVGCCGEW